MPAYYNEIDPQKAAWLRELMTAGVITPGDVDERSIVDVRPKDLRGYNQCHFFAGIGIWSYALRLAGWPDDREVWTGSCPCPSFSAAGKGQGFDDARHLWPAWFGLARQCRPPVCFGEQVDDAIGHGWLDLVQTDLEGEAYAVGKAVLGACSVGAPHIRQRLYFCADTAHSERARFRSERKHVLGQGGIGSDGDIQRGGQQRLLAEDCGTGDLRDTPERGQPVCGSPSGIAGYAALTGATRGFWRDCDWWYGKDGKYRPIERGLLPLAHGSAARVLRLRGYGDGIVAQVAAAFVRAYMDVSFA